MAKSAVVEVKVADHETVRALIAAISGAAETWTPEQVAEFQRLYDETLADGAGRHKIVSLPPDPVVTGRSIIIEWGHPRSGMMPGWDTAIYDAATGEQIMTASRIRVVDADAESLITADLTLFADEDGSPVYGGKPHVRDGEIITGVFRFDVAGMRVAGQ